MFKTKGGGGAKAFWTMFKKTADLVAVGTPNWPHSIACATGDHDRRWKWHRPVPELLAGATKTSRGESHRNPSSILILFLIQTPGWGSFVLHLLLGFCWDQDRNRWDGSQLLPSQTPTNHPSWFFWLSLISVPKGNFVNNKHVIATSSQQNPNNFFFIQFSISFVEVGILVGWMIGYKNGKVKVH